MSPTPYADLNRVLSEFVRGLGAVLGAELVAACLQGSFAVGDFDEHSDVDFVVATTGPLTDEQVAALQVLHAQVFELPCAWAQHLEGSYFPVDVLRSLERRDEELWYLDNGSSSLERSTHCNSAVVRQTVRQHGVRLFGAEPASLVDPVSVEELRREMLAVASDWGAEILREPERFASRFYQGFIALSYCRIWCDLVTGTVGSKRRGAEWAKERLTPGWAKLIDRAWGTRPKPEVSARQPAAPSDYQRTLELVRLVTDRCGEFGDSLGLEPGSSGCNEVA